MFAQVFENVRRATEFNVRTQQRLLRKWACLWGAPTPVHGVGEPTFKIQEQWAEFVTGQVKKQRDALEPHFKASLKIFEEACGLVEAKDPEELRAKTLDLWQKSFQCVRQFCETQMVDFETAINKWIELVSEVSVPEVGQILRDAEAPAA